MSLTFCRYLLWAMRLELVLGFIAMTLVVLLKSELASPTQIGSARMNAEPLVYAMSLVATLVSLRVFQDPFGVGVWLNSRGLTRRVHFQTRLLTGLIILAMMVMWPAVLMATGIRQAVQLAFESPWFPMVRWHELTVIPQMTLYAFVPYCLVTLLLMTSRTEDSQYPAFWALASGMSGLVISVSCLPFILQSNLIMLLVAVVLPLGCVGLSIVLAEINEQLVS